MLPYFSIIIPTHNSEEYLENCLRSILEQTFPDFEILVMDGCSQDKTLAIAERFKDDRISVYSEKDAGLYDAMNKGIKRSKGKWALFLGSDDKLYNKNVLEQMYREIMLRYASYDMVYGSVMLKKHGIKNGSRFSYIKVAYQNIAHQAIFYNRSIFDKYGTYDLNYPILADWEFNLRAFLNRRTKSAYVDLIISEYREGGLSDRIQDEKFNSDKHELLKRYGLTTLPIMFLKSLCKTNVEFFTLLIRRTRSFLHSLQL